MNSALLVSFDLIRPEEPPISLSIGSLLAYIRRSELCEKRFDLHHLAFNLADQPHLTAEKVVGTIASGCDLRSMRLIALSCYVWSEFLINPLVAHLRGAGFQGQIALGGYQIEYSNSLRSEYPDCQVFVKGYGEESLLKALTTRPVTTPLVLDHEPDFNAMPSPYLEGIIPLGGNYTKVRMETKRGCPYRCNFCAHQDLQRHKVYKHPRDRALQELNLFARKKVNKVNIVDPVFNTGPDYLHILEKLIERQPRYVVSLQTRLERIRGEEGERFLTLCRRLNVCVEFGLQSAVAEECAAVNRYNDLRQISHVLRRLNDEGIAYEVSLIYGLPLQTPGSFLKSIEFLRTHHCPTIRAFPLMLLKGTDLWKRRGQWGFREDSQGAFHIPVVVASNSFSEAGWLEMKAAADSLGEVERYL
jgi:radical SAM superfamily enzyme YgiQ (UPF0313 family)